MDYSVLEEYRDRPSLLRITVRCLCPGLRRIAGKMFRFVEATAGGVSVVVEALLVTTMFRFILRWFWLYQGQN